MALAVVLAVFTMLTMTPPVPAKLVSVREPVATPVAQWMRPDRKSTRLNSSHRCSSYAVFCLKKKKEPAQEGGHLQLDPHLHDLREPRRAHHQHACPEWGDHGVLQLPADRAGQDREPVPPLQT